MHRQEEDLSKWRWLWGATAGARLARLGAGTAEVYHFSQQARERLLCAAGVKNLHSKTLGCLRGGTGMEKGWMGR